MRELEPTVFIVDDDVTVLKGLEALMQSVRLRGEIYLSAADFFRNYHLSRRGCLILSVRLPRISGMEAYRQLRQSGSHLPVIFLTGHGDVATAVAAMRDGAFDFLEKPPNPQYLIDRVQAAIAKDQEDRHCLSEQNARVARLRALSSRELEVVDHLLQGKTSKSIARELGISLKTVDFHRADIMRKVRVETVAELVYLVVKSGYSRENRLGRAPETVSEAVSFHSCLPRGLTDDSSVIRGLAPWPTLARAI